MEKIAVGELYLKILEGEIINWDDISTNYLCDDKFIEEFSDKLDWYCLCKYQTLTENIVDKYAHKIDWKILSMYQKLTEDIIEKYKDKLSWYWAIHRNGHNKDFLLNKEFLLKYDEYITK